MSKPKNVWDGVYASFHEVRSSLDDCGDMGNDVWVDKSIARAKELLDDPALGNKDIELLAFACSALDSDLRVVDFGGSLGFSYLPLKAHLPHWIDYHIVEMPEICQVAESVFGDRYGLTFHTDIPKLDKVDIVYLRTSLQYTEYWKHTLCLLSNLRPKHFLFCHLSAGDIPTYASTQLYYDRRVPYWFINIGELDKLMENLDYTLMCESPGKTIAQDNFAEEYQLKQTCNRMFSRKIP